MVPKPQGESQATPRSRAGETKTLRPTATTPKFRPVPWRRPPHVPLLSRHGPQAAQFRVHRIDAQHPAMTVRRSGKKFRVPRAGVLTFR